MIAKLNILLDDSKHILVQNHQSTDYAAYLILRLLGISAFEIFRHRLSQHKTFRGKSRLFHPNKKWTPLEMGVVENKYYAKGIGFIFGVTIKGGDEQTELVRIRHQKFDNSSSATLRFHVDSFVPGC